MKDLTHKPVLLDEIIELLNPQLGDNFVDGTVGLGGHASAICNLLGPEGRLLAIDRDPRNLELARENLSMFEDRVIFQHGSYTDTKKFVYEHSIDSISGILLDLGFSSAHVEDASRGFSFQAEGPLDMRYDTGSGATAAEWVNGSTKEELSEVFRKYGEEPFANKLADAIVTARRKQKFETTTQLAELISEVVPRRGRQHPATRAFQALRIVVNDELREIERAIPELISVLKPGGRLAIITFHSLEDRVVKQGFRAAEKSGEVNLVNKKVLKPTFKETKDNPRARSAKLRVVEKAYDPNKRTQSSGSSKET